MQICKCTLLCHDGCFERTCDLKNQGWYVEEWLNMTLLFHNVLEDQYDNIIIYSHNIDVFQWSSCLASISKHLKTFIAWPFDFNLTKQWHTSWIVDPKEFPHVYIIISYDLRSTHLGKDRIGKEKICLPFGENISCIYVYIIVVCACIIVNYQHIPTRYILAYTELGRYQRNTCQGETAPNLWGLAANWEAQTWVSLRNSPSVEENLWSAPRPETPDDMGDDTREILTWIWDRYCQWLGRGNFGRRWYNVLIWSDFGVQGCRPCFSMFFVSMSKPAGTFVKSERWFDNYSTALVKHTVLLVLL